MIQDPKERLLSLKSKNLDILEEMDINCCYATQDKFWVTDPDGYQWEVYFFHQDAEFNAPKYSTNSNNGACCSPNDKKQKTNLKELKDTEACSPGSGCC